MVFLGKETIKGKVTRNDLQISYVLPITQSDFNVLLQRIQTQSNMTVRNDTTQWVFQKFADEGSSFSVYGPAFYGHHATWEAVFADSSKREDFDKAYEFVLMTLLNARTTAQDTVKVIFRGAAPKSGTWGEIARVQGQVLHTDENTTRNSGKRQKRSSIALSGCSSRECRM